MAEAFLILGLTRAKDDPRGNVTGLIYREDERMKWGSLADMFKEGAPQRFFRLVESHNKPIQQTLERLEYTVSGTARFLFRQTDGKLVHEELREKLLFSEGKKALLSPQILPKPLAIATLALEYLEVARLSDTMRREMLGGERSQGQLAQVLGIQAADPTFIETLWELSRQKFLTVHDSGASAAENAIGLNKPVAGLKV